MRIARVSIKLAPALVLALATAVSGHATAGVTEQAICSFGTQPPGPCTVTDRVRRDGSHVMDFRAGERRARFIGRARDGWWSGLLDGRPAMGRELNRGRIAYRTTDLTRAFEWWYPGSEHGTY